MKRLTIILAFILAIPLNILAQNFYDVDYVREIKLYFNQPNWDHLLDSLYLDGLKERLLASVEIDGTMYNNVGVRYKGFSSVSINTIKNPFNIKLDYVDNNQNHEGFEKIKLSNVIKDPSFLREVLSYEIARDYMPSPRANFANVYVNDTLWGLYVNVEAINDKFTNKHFATVNSPLVKCNPLNLNLTPGGENSNLSNTHGTDSTLYYDYYDLKSNYGWGDLHELIDVLNNSSSNLDNKLNVDRTLWMHAFNYTLINFDSYVGYGQNYYLYKSLSNQFQPILWDLNMSFGGFRLTDATQAFFNGFDINQAQTMDPLGFLSNNFLSPRPLISNLLSDPRKQRMYLAHMKTIVEDHFSNQDYFSRAQYLQNLISNDVQNDPNKFYSFNDFTTNLTSQVSLPSSICPGITQLMDSRSTYLTNYWANFTQPIISNIQSLPNSNQIFGNDLTITAEIQDASYAMLAYRFGENMPFQEVEMYDDGNHNDGNANDGVYGVVITNCSNSIDYYLYADNSDIGVFSPKNAAYEFYNIKTKVPQSSLVINEVMANNVTTIMDETGDYDDWIELYNNSNTPISTNGLLFSDNPLNLDKWDLPNIVVYPNSYFIIWADEDGNTGDNHANFKLSNLGEQLILSNSDSSIVDAEFIYPQNDDIAYGRFPNGIGSFTMLTPTFNANNSPTSNDNVNIEETFSVFPNPFDEFIKIETDNNFYITNALGQKIYQSQINSVVNTKDWKDGLYILHSKESNYIIKLIKMR